jgi:predicted NUDIX family NTP pyrophosphohydrolase
VVDSQGGARRDGGASCSGDPGVSGGDRIPIAGSFLPLPSRKQPGGKTVLAWAVEGDLEAGQIRSNTFSLEWPKGSDRRKEFPEVDRAEWFEIPEAKRRILAGQAGFLDDLCERLGRG